MKDTPEKDGVVEMSCQMAAMFLPLGRFRDARFVCARLFAFWLLLLFHQEVTAQSQNMNALIPAVVPPSPEAMALGKYGNTPVGLSSGIPNINIPLYTIKHGSLEVPISASYMASGVKVADIPTWIGLGWTLNATGVVSRSVVGQPDDLGFWYTQSRNTSQITPSLVDWVYGMANGGGDNESDFYFYNFNGHAGKFVFPQNQPDQPFIITDEAIRIIRSSGGFTIFDEVGTEYRFWSVENSNVTISGSSNTYASSYFLTSIISADGKDQIDFNYVPDDGIQPLFPVYTETIGATCPGNGTQHVPNSTGSGNSVVMIKLASIVWANGKVEFTLDPTRLDGPGGRLDEIKIYEKKMDGTFTIDKRFSFAEAYFGNSGNYRLKLASIIEKDATNTPVRAHHFTYDESIDLPMRTSAAQDWWGFYNGHTGNSSLIAQATINLNGTSYTVGNGNSRDPSPAHMQAYVLKKVTYPTGGYTEFDYEPHQYEGGATVQQTSVAASSGVMGNSTDLLQQIQTFTPVSSGWAKISTLCSNVTSATPYYSRVLVTQQSNGRSLLDYQYSPTVDPLFPPTRSQDFMIYVTGGVSYSLQVMSQGASTATQFGGAAYSQASASWENVSNVATSTAGGLRVKEIRDYPSATDAPITKIYKYGDSENGLGKLMIPTAAFSNRVQQLTIKYYSGPPCAESCSGTRQIISSATRYDLTSLNGAVVVYPEVTVYEKDISVPNGPNGKRVSRFDVVADTYGPGEQAYGNIGYQVDNSWRGGNEFYSKIVRTDGTLVRETINTHGIYRPREIYGTKIGWRVVYEGCMNPFTLDPGQISQNFYWFDYPYYSGVKKPYSVQEVSYSQTNPAEFIANQMNYYYDNFSNDHQQLKRVVTTDSDGNTRQTNYWYPADYDAVDNVPSLISEHIIATPIKEETYVNNQIVSGKVSRLNVDGKPIEIYQYESATPQTAPTHSPTIIVPSGYIKKADVSYDATTKRISQTQLSNNTKSSYLWGYNNAHPIAMVVNASVTDVAATSFESDGKGNWTYAGPVYSDISVKSGTNYYKLGGGSMTKSLPAGTYKLEYWGKGTINLSGGTITAIRTAPADGNGWILYEKRVVLSTTTTLTISGAATALIDEVRVYPITAQMTTYTYDRLDGMTSTTDPNNLITYFEYDAFGRLRQVKDYKGDIVKTNEYHYKGY